MRKRIKNKFIEDLGFRIRQARCLNKLSQKDLGERIGVTHQTIYRYEAGEIHMSPESIFICAKALNKPVGYFFGEDCQQPSPSNTNRVGLMVAAEIMDLPDDNIRKGIYKLVCSINQCRDLQDKKREQV